MKKRHTEVAISQEQEDAMLGPYDAVGVPLAVAVLLELGMQVWIGRGKRRWE
jgi:hypothetical protein